MNMDRREFTGSVCGSALAGAGAVHLLGARAAKAADSRERIKIGQIGTGHAHASGKISTIRKFSEDYELVGVVEADEERKETAKRERAYDGVKWLTEEQLLNTKGLKAVAVETVVDELVPTAARCIAGGLHVHLDKPAGESLRDFKQLLDDATRSRLVIQMGYMFRYSPAFQLCYKAVREGWLGDVFEVHGVISKSINAERRKELEIYAGGTMYELGCHLIDSLVYVLGKPDATTAYVRRTRPHQDTLADNQIAVFEYPRATATIRSALIEPFGFERRQFVVCGDKGVVDIRPLEPPRLQLALTEPHQPYQKGYQEVDLPRLSGRYDGDFTDFAMIIRGEMEPDFTPEHDLAAHEAILQASGLPLE